MLTKKVNYLDKKGCLFLENLFLINIMHTLKQSQLSITQKKHLKNSLPCILTTFLLSWQDF